MNMYSLQLEKIMVNNCNYNSFLENIIQCKSCAQWAAEAQYILTCIVAESLSLGKEGKYSFLPFEKKNLKEKNHQKLGTYSMIGVLGIGTTSGNKNSPFLSGDNKLVKMFTQLFVSIFLP